MLRSWYCNSTAVFIDLGERGGMDGNSGKLAYGHKTMDRMEKPKIEKKGGRAKKVKNNGNKLWGIFPKMMPAQSYN
ncbi:MAG: hypothetical protein AABX01_02535 [Candidatus Micrarchaeota archaeon]